MVFFEDWAENFFCAAKILSASDSSFCVIAVYPTMSVNIMAANFLTWFNLSAIGSRYRYAGVR